MTREEIIEKVKDVLSDEFEIDKSVMDDDAIIYQALELDSLALVDLVAIIDYTFKVKIVAAELHDIKTFSQLYDVIEKRI